MKKKEERILLYNLQRKAFKKSPKSRPQALATLSPAPIGGDVGIERSHFVCFLSRRLSFAERGIARRWVNAASGGQDLTPGWTLLMRWNRRQREAPPALRGLQPGMLLTPLHGPDRPDRKSSSTASLIRKKDSLGAPSPARCSICAQARAKLMHFSSLQ